MTRKYERSYKEAKRLNRAVAEFICMDQIPISVVDKRSFRNLVEQPDKRYEIPRRKYFSEREIPTLHNETRSALLCLYNRTLGESNSGLIYGCYNSLH